MTSSEGTFKTERVLDESALVAFLGRTVPRAATEFRDHKSKWKACKDMIPKLKNRRDLDSYESMLEKIDRETLPVYREKLEAIMTSHDFSPAFAEAFAISSRLAMWVLGSFLLRFVAKDDPISSTKQANMIGFDATLEEMWYHGERMDLFRTTANVLCPWPFKECISKHTPIKTGKGRHCCQPLPNQDRSTNRDQGSFIDDKLEIPAPTLEQAIFFSYKVCRVLQSYNVEMLDSTHRNV